MVYVGEYSSQIPRYEGDFQKYGFVPLLIMNQHSKASTHPQRISTHSAGNQVLLEEFVSWLSMALLLKNYPVVVRN